MIKDAFQAKRKTKCKSGQMYANWSYDHEKDGIRLSYGRMTNAHTSIRLNLSSSPTPITVASNNNNSIIQHNSLAPKNNEKNTFKFGSAFIIYTPSPIVDGEIKFQNATMTNGQYLTISNVNTAHKEFSRNISLGPLIDYVAPYSVLAKVKLGFFY